MNLTLFAGAALILLGGALQGTFAVPMKYTHKWNHENTWLIFCLTGMVIFPWLLTAGTVPALGQVYAATPARVLAYIVFSGLLWGVGATLVGVGLNLLGIGLGSPHRRSSWRRRSQHRNPSRSLRPRSARSSSGS